MPTENRRVPGFQTHAPAKAPEFEVPFNSRTAAIALRITVAQSRPDRPAKDNAEALDVRT
ncbi:hypothetical protein [Rhodococcus sp. NPDC056516]|uniref:hypothetical protein n=1 Tax=Rhodococcus sp. NPDC056516 TaxID=3345847 RepID=UPI00366F6F79